MEQPEERSERKYVRMGRARTLPGVSHFRGQPRPCEATRSSPQGGTYLTVCVDESEVERGFRGGYKKTAGAFGQDRTQEKRRAHLGTGTRRRALAACKL